MEYQRCDICGAGTEAGSLFRVSPASCPENMVLRHVDCGPIPADSTTPIATPPPPAAPVEAPPAAAPPPPLEADSIEDDEYTAISQAEIATAARVNQEADRLRRRRQDAPPVDLTLQGTTGTVLQPFFSLPPPSAVRHAERMKTFRMDRQQTVIANSAVQALARTAPNEWGNAMDRWDEAIIEILRIFAGIGPDDLKAMNGRFNASGGSDDSE